MFGIFKRQSPPDDAHIFNYINQAIVEKRTLTTEEWNKMLLATHKRIIYHEETCGQRWGFLIVIILVLAFYEHGSTLINFLSKVS